MSYDETVSFSLEVNVEQAYTQVRKLEMLFSRTLGMVQRLTGDENLNRSIGLMRRAIAVANQLRLAMAALQVARMAAGDPIAWATAGLAGAEFAFDLYDVINR